MFTIQQINGRKKHHFKFLEMTNFPIFTNQQINSVSHIVTNVHNSSDRWKKKNHFNFLEITIFQNFQNQQFNSISHIVHYLYNHNWAQFKRSTAKKYTISNFWRSHIFQINKSAAFCT